jgi:hypothetical protein
MRTSRTVRFIMDQWTLAWLGLVLLAPVLQGCKAPGHTFPFDYTGEPGVSVPVTFYSDVPQVEVVVDNNSSYDFLLDTGAPATILDGAAYAMAPGIYPASTVETLGITVLDLDCAVLSLFGGALTIGGILGGDIFRNFALTVDYRGAWATLYTGLDGEPPPGDGDGEGYFGPTTTRSFELLGGGLLSTDSGENLPVPPTRVIMTLDIEGHDVLAVLDTGASSVVLDETLYWDLMDWRPERPVLEGFEVLTPDATHDAVITRLASLRIASPGGVHTVQTSVPALAVLGSDDLVRFSEEVGRDVQALLGGAFLRYYQLTIDYPARQVTLQPYLETDHVDPEEYVGVGFTWDQVATGNVVVERVLPGTDAHDQGVAEGDRILTANAYNILLTGEGGVDSAVAASVLGETVSFTLERADATAIYEILVEDLLPPFL